MEAPLKDAAQEIERLRRCVTELAAANERLKADLAERTLTEGTLRDGEPNAGQILDCITALGTNVTG